MRFFLSYSAECTFCDDWNWEGLFTRDPTHTTTTTTATCLSWTKSLWLTQLPHLPSPHACSKHHGQKAVTYSVWCRQIINLILKCSQRRHFKFELEITSIKFVPSGKLQLPSLTRSSLSLSLWFTCPSSSLSAIFFFPISYFSLILPRKLSSSEHS